MDVIKRRAVGGTRLHFLEGRQGNHSRVALCGHDPDAGGRRGTESRAGWRYPGEDRDNMQANPKDCARCVDVLVKRGGQFQPGED